MDLIIFCQCSSPSWNIVSISLAVNARMMSAFSPASWASRACRTAAARARASALASHFWRSSTCSLLSSWASTCSAKNPIGVALLALLSGAEVGRVSALYAGVALAWDIARRVRHSRRWAGRRIAVGGCRGCLAWAIAAGVYARPATWPRSAGVWPVPAAGVWRPPAAVSA